MSSGSIHYYFTDHLGPASAVTDSAGTSFDEKLDYYPYGGIVPTSTENVPQNYKFTGKERDAESGLDMFGARHYASTMGRFVAPDPGNVKLKHLLDPQGLNRYVYVRDNPLSYVDPNGKDWAKAWEDLKTFANSLYEKVTVGAGIYGKGQVGGGEAKVGVAYKNTIKLTSSSISLTQSVEASAEFGIKDGPKVGKSKGAEQTVVAADTSGVTTHPGEDQWNPNSRAFVANPPQFASLSH